MEFQLVRHEMHIIATGNTAEGYIDLVLAGPEGTHPVSLAIRWPDGTTSEAKGGEHEVRLTGKGATNLHVPLRFSSLKPGTYGIVVTLAHQNLGEATFTLD